MSWSSTRTTSHLRRLRSLIAVGTLFLLGAAPARAEFTPVAPPAAGYSIDGFGASQGAWLVGLGGSLTAVEARISRDRGQTWTAVAVPAGPGGTLGRFSGITVGPDGAFYVAARYQVAVAPGSFARLLRIAPATGAVSIAATLPLPATDAALGAPAFDAQGRVWVAWLLSGATTLTAARIAGGAIAESYQAPAPTTQLANGEIQFRSSGMWVRMGNRTYRLTGGALVLAPQGIPTLEDGALTVTQNQISLDGGQSFVNGFQGGTGVEGDTSLLASSYGILRRHSPALFSPTAQNWAQSGPLINRVVATDGGLVAFTDDWRLARNIGQGWRMLWHPGPVTAPPFATGPLSALFTSWLTSANAMRAQAGLPPLVGDPAISTAAENHSRYGSLNGPGADAHSETPGAPGFTGARPSDRCAAAGGPVSCSEVMYPSHFGTNPVPAWVATAYHRGLIMGPTGLMVGGGQVDGGPAVMDAGPGGGLLVGPVMYPQGVYDGPLWFAGETPDPAANCRASGQQVTLPLAVAVSLDVPGGTLTGYTLTPVGGQPLRACVLGGLLLADEPLLAGTDYDVTVLWQPTAQMPPQRISWKFSTAGRPPPPSPPPGPPPVTTPPPPPVVRPPALPTSPPAMSPWSPFAGSTAPAPACTSSLQRMSARVKKPRSIGVRVRSCGAGVATVGVYRINARTARQRRSLARRTVTLRTAGTWTVRLSTRSVPAGRFALRIRLKAIKAKSRNTTIVVARR